MLQELFLQNVAVFKAQRIHAQPGMTIIAGEAGSGKSILMDSLDALFGAQVGAKEMLRQGADRGQVSALFELPLQHFPTLKDTLEAEGIELETDALNTPTALELVREFSASGSRFRLNGSSVSRKFVQEIRPTLLELQSQHSTVGLMGQATQQALLDAMGGPDHQTQLKAVARIYHQWRETQRALEAYESEAQQAEQRLHVLRLQVDALDALNITNPNEDVELEDELNRLSHAEELKLAYTETQQLLLGGNFGEGEAPNLLDAMAMMRKRLAQVAQSEKRLSPVLEQLEALREQMREMSIQLGTLDDEVEMNPQRMDDIQARLSELQKMKRLYGPSLAAVMATHEAASRELADLEFRQANPEALRQEAERLHQQLAEAAEALSQSRLTLARRLENSVHETLTELAMPYARFEVVMETCPFYAQGQERASFHLSANLGEAPKPLGKVASGGELSRVLLALTVATLGGEENAPASGATKLYVFDEIDTGTSGQAAKTIARQLQKLAARGHQVFVVTHQPIVAAAGHHHWWVHKQVEAGETVSQVNTSLDEATVHDILIQLASGEAGEKAQAQANRDFAQSLREQMKV